MPNVHRVTSVIAFLFLAGCTTATLPSVPQQPVPKAGETISIDSSKTPKKGSTYSPRHLSYKLPTISLLSALSDSSHRSDSSRVTAVLRMTLVAGLTHKTVIAHVEADSSSVAIGSSASVPILPIPPWAFTVNTETGQVVPINPEVIHDCAT